VSLEVGLKDIDERGHVRGAKADVDIVVADAEQTASAFPFTSHDSRSRVGGGELFRR
jgi:hypothetical protein